MKPELNNEKPRRRLLNAEVRVLDDQRGIVEYVASDETIDSYREVILASGWRFDLFQKNAPFVDSHDYSGIDKLVGKVLDWRIEGRRLVETVQWAIDVPENGLAQLGWKMTQGGYLKAVSVGFFPVAAVGRWMDDPKPFQQLCQQLGVDPTVVSCIYTEQQQIELSACILGANPNALAKAMREGAIAEGDITRAFREPTAHANEASRSGAASGATLARTRSWFLEKLQRAVA